MAEEEEEEEEENFVVLWVNAGVNVNVSCSACVV